jgi:hypothetical protein
MKLNEGVITYSYTGFSPPALVDDNHSGRGNDLEAKVFCDAFAFTVRMNYVFLITKFRMAARRVRTATAGSSCTSTT